MKVLKKKKKEWTSKKISSASNWWPRYYKIAELTKRNTLIKLKRPSRPWILFKYLSIRDLEARNKNSDRTINKRIIITLMLSGNLRSKVASTSRSKTHSKSACLNPKSATSSFFTEKARWQLHCGVARISNRWTLNRQSSYSNQQSSDWLRMDCVPIVVAAQCRMSHSWWKNEASTQKKS